MAITRAKQSSLTTGVTKYDNFRGGLPYTPTIGTATDGGTGTTVSVAFTGNNTAGLTYTALSTPGSLTGTGTTSPITVTGLTSGTAYTFAVKATNSAGDSPYSAASNSVTPATPSSFESIASVTGTGTSASLSFTSIPGTYKSLQIRAITRDAVASTSLFAITARLNSSASGYAFHKLYGNGSTVTATGAATQTYMLELPCVSNNSTSGIVSTHIIDIHDYASTTKNKTVRVISGTDLNGSGEIHLQSGLWANTSAITSIIFYAPYDGFTTATTFALYGIKG